MAMKKLAQVNLLFVLERNTEAVAQRCPIKKVFPEISQNSQKNTCTRVSLLKKRLWHSCFPVNFAKFLGAPFLTEHLRK